MLSRKTVFNTSSLWLLCLIINCVFQTLSAYNADFTQKIYNEYLRGYDIVTPKQYEPSLPQSIGDLLSNITKSFKFEFTPLSKPFQLKMLCESFPLAEVKNETENIIDLHTITELEMIRGKQRPEDHLISRITSALNNENEATSFLSSSIAEKRFVEMLCMPTTDIQILQKRQAIISHFANNEQLRRESFKVLENIKKYEEHFLHFSTKTEVSAGVKQSVFPLIPHAEEIPGLANATSALNNIVNNPFFMPTTIIASMKYLGLKVQNLKNPEILANITIPSLLFAPITCAAFQTYNNAKKQVQAEIIHAAQYIRSINQLLLYAATNPTLQQLFPQAHREYGRLNGFDKSTSQTFNDLNELLRESTFDDEDPSLFTSAGNICRAYKYLCNPEVRKEYNSTLEFVGEIAIYIALAEKIVFHAQNKEVPFCFVNFVKDSPKPILEITNFWNPFIKTSDAVCNTINLNTKGHRSLLITGPNTGGKSTNMKAIAINLLTAQTFGIAAAQGMNLTPFTNILTYLNISDDTAGGESLFKAEVNRAQNLMATLKSLKEDEFGFAMIDEIFTGTSPDKAEGLSYDFMKAMSALPNVIFVNATHFKKLTGLEAATNGIIKNHQVEALTDSAGRVTKYTYKIIPGVSQISSAMQVAQESGINF
jgi:energy-coupling factor transporter ATP-binding protein EcfA2